MQMNNRLETWSDFASFRMRGRGLVSLRHDISPGIEVGLEEPTSSLPIDISIAQNIDLLVYLSLKNGQKQTGKRKIYEEPYTNDEAGGGREIFRTS